MTFVRIQKINSDNQVVTQQVQWGRLCPEQFHLWSRWHMVPVSVKWQLEKPLVTKFLETSEQILCNDPLNYPSLLQEQNICKVPLRHQTEEEKKTN